MPMYIPASTPPKICYPHVIARNPISVILGPGMLKGPDRRKKSSTLSRLWFERHGISTRSHRVAVILGLTRPEIVGLDLLEGFGRASHFEISFPRELRPGS